MNENLTHAYAHRLADVHLAGFAPAFTLSLCDSEYARKPPVPIASVVTIHYKNHLAMKKLLTLLLCLFCFHNIWANSVNENTALTVAENFYNQNRLSQLRSASVITLVYKCLPENETNLRSSNSITYYYVYNIGENGFIIVSGNDVTTPILAYSTESTFNESQIPLVLKSCLSEYENQIKYAFDNNIQSDVYKNIWSNLINNQTKFRSAQTSISPLLTTKWNQLPYYNDLCPLDSETNEKVPTGCAATAMAQIMKYYNFPQRGNGFHSYKHPKYGIRTSIFSIPYEWYLMPDSLKSTSTTSQKNAVANLMADCGVAVEMDYGTDGSSTQILEKFGGNKSSEYAYKHYFNYAVSVQGIERINYSDIEWINILKNELNNGRPIQYSGYGQPRSGGHTFVCDGYDSNNYFHMNWGWGGLGNGYYLLNNLIPDVDGAGAGAGNYSYEQEAVIGITPNPEITEEITMMSSMSVLPSTIGFGNSFSVSLNLKNTGLNNFLGNFCVAVFSLDGNVIDFVETKENVSLSTNEIKTLTFSTSGILKMTPNNYILIPFFKTNNIDWTILNEGSYSYMKNLTINAFQNDLKLYKELAISTNDIINNKPFDVTFDIINDGISTYDGSLFVTLSRFDGSIAATIGGKVISLQSGYHYTNGLKITSSGIDVEAGEYLMLVADKPSSSSNASITGARSGISNPILVTVKEQLTPDIYEDNDASPYTLPVVFNNDTSIIRTSSSNIDTISDIDIYKIDLEDGYSYKIIARLQDKCNSDDNNDYTIDSKFIYVNVDEGNPSKTFDVSSDTIYASGTSSFGFIVTPYFLGETGTYELDIKVIRTLSTNIDNVKTNNNSISVYPNPAKDFVFVNSNNTENMSKIYISDLAGNIIKQFNKLNTSSFELPVSNLIEGMYLLNITDTKGNLFIEKIIIKK